MYIILNFQIIKVMVQIDHICLLSYTIPLCCVTQQNIDMFEIIQCEIDNP